MNVPRETRQDRLANLLLDMTSDGFNASEAREQLAAMLDRLMERVEELESLHEDELERLRNPGEI